ncbi:HAMP domain-containing histidine kinase [Thiospirochaeta perfilievii]|uniref:histidine kinase n=1 Tax=Thiospirochaeta perfilievii TaxID=252967 RepID=A0A5C1Q9N0_9SPIO|nr:HAMP domain-containing sensor histidine kinase [Thiospirochaeta perfilievii]QEN04177.1 HAMP domain-containing histidine kinase [Thiospirochaeta perfilievii]
MTIITRLKLSYTSLVLVPFLVFIFTSAFYKDDFMFTIHGLKLSVQTEQFNRVLYKTLDNNPDSMLTEEKLRELISYTKYPEYITCFVVINDKVQLSVGRELKVIERYIQEQKYLNYWIFNTTDGRTASVYFINTRRQYQTFPIGILYPIIFYIIFISLLSYLTAKKITRPLNKLKNAALSIKDEDFDIDLSYNKVDEIKDVFIAFDEMRLRLKHNVEKQLKYEKSRTELIANISHDLKTPITAIKGYIEGIVDGVANTPQKMQKYHETIFRKVNLLDSLIDNLFLSSKLELRNEPFHFTIVNLNMFLSDLIEEIRFDKPDLKIDINSSNSKTMINADPIQLQRVIYNIIGNSIKYNDKERCEILVSIDTDTKFTKISIMDNGIGIDTENLDKIFNQFFRSDPARSSSTEGTGLGLSIAKQIIREHGGKIWGTNNSNNGVTISFTLPIIKE